MAQRSTFQRQELEPTGAHDLWRGKVVFEQRRFAWRNLDHPLERKIYHARWEVVKVNAEVGEARTKSAQDGTQGTDSSATRCLPLMRYGDKVTITEDGKVTWH
mmetsp:Transcript_6144/g.10655  ORF Transcript_6144/g.10655 Transcript_6144/m.10655 type:complete len:103 (+) Transcript_6144:31-339(+)